MMRPAEDPRWLDHPRGPWLLTYSGRRFYPFDPRADEVDVRDIAHALANICRFGGHTRHHYSVAQHSVLVSRIVDPRFALIGLMHDAAEAYVGDMIAPIKLASHARRAQVTATGRRIEGYQHMEDLVWCAIVKAFDLDRHGVTQASTVPPEVKHADIVALVTEARDMMGVADVGRAPGWPSDVEPLASVTIEAVVPAVAEDAFLARWDELTGQDIGSRLMATR